MSARSATVTAVIIAFAGLFAEAAQAQVPSINLQETCKAASGVMLALLIPPRAL